MYYFFTESGSGQQSVFAGTVAFGFGAGRAQQNDRGHAGG